MPEINPCETSFQQFSQDFLMKSFTDTKCRKFTEFVFKTCLFYCLLKCGPVIIFWFFARTKFQFQDRGINFQLYCDGSIFGQGGIPLKYNSISGISQCLFRQLQSFQLRDQLPCAMFYIKLPPYPVVDPCRNYFWKVRNPGFTVNLE